MNIGIDIRITGTIALTPPPTPPPAEGVNLWPQPAMDSAEGLTLTGNVAVFGGKLVFEGAFELTRAQVTSLAEPIVAGATYSYAFTVASYATEDMDTLRLIVGDQVVQIDHDGAYSGTLTMGVGEANQAVMFRDTDGACSAFIDDVVIQRVS
jgi:hypothetical protein